MDWKAVRERLSIYLSPLSAKVVLGVLVAFSLLGGVEGCIATLGPKAIADKEWFPLSQHVPVGWWPWLVTLSFFLISLAVADGAVHRLRAAEDRRKRGETTSEERIRELKADLEVERARATDAARNAGPEVTPEAAQLGRLRLVRGELARLGQEGLSLSLRPALPPKEFETWHARLSTVASRGLTGFEFSYYQQEIDPLGMPDNYTLQQRCRRIGEWVVNQSKGLEPKDINPSLDPSSLGRP